MSALSSFTRPQVLSFLASLGYPIEDRPSTFTLLLLEGVVPDAEDLAGGQRWTFEGDLSEIWDAKRDHHLRPRPELRVLPRASRLNTSNDLLVGVGRTADGTTIFWGALANMHAGTVYGDDRRGWPRLADGEHFYRVSERYEGVHRGMPCLRPLARGNRVVRELPSGPNGGDGVLSLNEFLDQQDPDHRRHGYAYNPSILCHPGETKDSAGCWGTVGHYGSTAWEALMAGARMQEKKYGYIRVIVWRGADLLLWRQAGEPSPGRGEPPWDGHWRPAVRPGCAGPWVSALQRLLQITVDARFGKETGRALMERRRRAGLDVSMPAVDPQEWAMLETRP